MTPAGAVSALRATARAIAARGAPLKRTAEGTDTAGNRSQEKPIANVKVGAERRVAAPHPGTIVKRDYVDAAGLSVADLAAHCGMDPGHLAAVLAGEAPLDVHASVALARSLLLPAERLMHMQTRYDFARARTESRSERIEPFARSAALPFPETDLLRGRLGIASERGATDASLFFKEDVADYNDDPYAGFHGLWRGDRLRVVDDAGRALWHGPILHDFDNRVLLPFLRSWEWIGWFEARYAAHLAVGPEHAAFLERRPSD